MADALLGIVIENLGSLVQEELATFLGVGELTQRLSGNLTAIRAVLKDAEERQITSRAVKDWLQKLRDAAHVLDDILDECSIVFREDRDNKCITRFHPKEILVRRDIGKRMKEVAKRIDAIAHERTKFELHAAGNKENQPKDDEWRQTVSVITEPKVYGRDQDREQVVELLIRHATDREELSVFPIVGHGGYGKTTLAQLVFNDDRVTSHFDLKIWICVSDDDFSMMKILQSIIEYITGKKPDVSSLEPMQKKVQEVLQSKRYLLVLDDVWNEYEEKWNMLKHLLQCGNGTKGSSILVTTRLETVASIMGTCRAHRLEGLSEDEIWQLFRQHAFEPNMEERAELVAIGKEIVRKCVGSPLAAKVLGSLLRFKSAERWLSIKESKLWNLSEDKDKDNRIMSALRLSYFNLKLSLRPCFCFCAVFPKDFVMVKEDLIHLWMANEFISSRENLVVEHVGSEMWDELCQRSFFQEVKIDEKGNTTFKMHDLVHDLAKSIVGEECVASKAASLTDLKSRVHHIGCSLNFDKRFNYNTIPFEKVESLRTFLEFDPPFNNLGALPSISPLRALCTSSFRLSALKNLTHLRYLELYESRITTLPESVCGLKKLQVLKLVSCDDLSSLPKELIQLQDLRHLVIKDCGSLVSMPSKIGQLTCLKTLSIFIVGSEEGFGLAELRDLQLGGKLHIKGLENVPSDLDAREANLIGKRELNHLYLTWGSNANSQANAERVLEALEPHPGLKSFGMNYYEGIHFPCWMRNTSFLKGLVKVILYGCENCQQLPPLGKLPCLTTLYVSGMRDVKYIDDDLYEPATEKAFIALKELNLHHLPKLERMLEAEGVEMLPQLSDLCISGVPKLALPSLPSVEVLDARGFNIEDVASFYWGMVCNMHNLKKLFICAFVKLKVLPDGFSTLGALEELRISNWRELESFPEHVLQGLSSLRRLIIEDCSKLKSLSEGMGHLTRLESLTIEDCPLLVLPSNMNRLTSLRNVTIYGTSENNKLPEGLECISSMQILTLLYFPFLTSLPDWLGTITSLQKLVIKWCPELRSLPDSFQQLRNLRELHISGCPKLVKRCSRGTGEDWHKIAHVPELKLELDEELTSCEKIIYACEKKWKKLFTSRQHHHRAPVDYFSYMVDR